MRTYQINVNGKDYTVQIDNPNASPATVQVNGKTFQVKITEQSAAVKPVSNLDDDSQMEETYVPMVTSTFVETATDLESEPAAAPTTAETAGKGLQQVIAPMPGKVMDIVVQVGSQVKQGDTLCNLEAMKMKSPIRSTGDGKIAQILIGEGQNVNYGEVLFTLE